MKLRIVHKGLLFLCLPLAVQGLFFIQLFSLIGQTEKSVERQAQHINMAREMNFVIIQFCHTLANCSKGYNGLMSAAEYRKLMDSHLAALETYVKDTSEDYQQVFQSSKSLLAAQYKLLEVLQAHDSEESLNPMQRFLLTKEVVANAESAAPIIYRTWTREEKLLEEERIEEQRAREKIKRLILLASAFDFVLGLVCITFFIKNITHRVDLLVQNARVLPTSNNLPHKVKGSDEIAFLDEAMHEASDELIKAAGHRKSLLQMMAHDLKNPLTAIGLNFQVMLMGGEFGQITVPEEKIRSLYQSLTQITTLLGDMLALDRMEATDLKLDLDLVNAALLVRDCCDLTRTQAEEKAISLQMQIEPLSVIADRNRLLQVISNFVGNAIRYSPTGSVVQVQVERKNAQVLFSVIDQGPGIERNLQRTVFERFFQVKENKGDKSGLGYGLGLAICKQIIEKHQGQIGVTSVPGKGATFWFCLPMDKDDDENEIRAS